MMLLLTGDLQPGYHLIPPLEIVLCLSDELVPGQLVMFAREEQGSESVAFCRVTGKSFF